MVYILTLVLSALPLLAIAGPLQERDINARQMINTISSVMSDSGSLSSQTPVMVASDSSSSQGSVDAMSSVSGNSSSVATNSMSSSIISSMVSATDDGMLDCDDESDSLSATATGTNPLPSGSAMSDEDDDCDDDSTIPIVQSTAPFPSGNNQATVPTVIPHSTATAAALPSATPTGQSNANPKPIGLAAANGSSDCSQNAATIHQIQQLIDQLSAQVASLTCASCA